MNQKRAARLFGKRYPALTLTDALDLLDRLETAARAAAPKWRKKSMTPRTLRSCSNAEKRLLRVLDEIDKRRGVDDFSE